MTDVRHPSHVTRVSDGGSFDEICVHCGQADVAGGGWGGLAEPCYVPVPENWVEQLPALMRPEHSRLFLRAESPEAIGLMRDWIARYEAACDWAMEFAKSEGAESFVPPWDGENRYARWFAFEQKPDDPDKAWSFSSRRQKDRYWHGTARKKGASAKALVERMAAGVPFPRNDELANAIEAIYSVSYRDVDDPVKGNWGSSVVGRMLTTVQPCWAGDAYFLVVANPMQTLASSLESARFSYSFDDTPPPDKTKIRFQFTGNQHQPEGGIQKGATHRVHAWRPPAGWALTSQAQVELVFAQHKVDQEAEKVAA